jgi:hypothetical protein
MMNKQSLSTTLSGLAALLSSRTGHAGDCNACYDRYQSCLDLIDQCFNRAYAVYENRISGLPNCDIGPNPCEREERKRTLAHEYFRELIGTLEMYGEFDGDCQQQSSCSGLVIGEGGRWFQPSGGMRINLGRRGPLRRILLSLAEHRLSNPGIGLKVSALVEAGWPGERMLYKAGIARAYTTIQRLRNLGLQRVLITADDGYLLSPTLPVQIEPS